MNRHFERGTTMVETALVLSVLLLLIFGIMDFGRLLYSFHMVDNAARLGARFAIVRGSDCQHYVGGAGDTWPCPAGIGAAKIEIANYVSQQSIAMGLGPIPTSGVNTVWTYEEGCVTGAANTYNNMPGCQVAVTVTYTYQFWLPFMPNTGGLGIPLTSTSKMLISQ